MKKFRIIIFSIPILLGLSLFFLAKKKQEIIEIEKANAPYSVEYVKNLIFNSSFEIGQGNEAKGWKFEREGNEAFFERDVIEKFDGKFSANITSDNPASKSYLVQEVTNFPKEKKFILYGAVKTYNADTAFMRIEVYDTLGNLKSFNSTKLLTGTNDWLVYTCAIIVGKDAGKINVKCVLNGKGRVWFDDVELVAVKYEEKDYPFWWKYWTRQFAK
ncbi:hypothetical protein [Candidatus Chrysopegis kryptomonas]|uniref:CBM-cenC domain-containing protein n=1 Tax=Candidatus Chryseopegocella kryptomonas TaxID=1633643 RepID=A0A0P1MWV7_9BACT|nr:hypothetical protein [Candidatus Chrysopegis kryptomonas]CUT00256.1 hypothetical protein JGI23_00821 [Candidatus Chrysopegis kryptomonas]